jgi:DNA-binding transcriptional regulator YhcF (GntR family)
MFSLDPDARTALIGKRVGSVRHLARTLGLAHTTVLRTVRGDWRGLQTQQAIANACKISRVKMFGANPVVAA